ncbi:MAG: outer membrane beta-barrel protein [Bacteroidales bacterium]|nr:outer membrane beta-barrel protein [Bacteroidales bacterium]
MRKIICLFVLAVSALLNVNSVKAQITLSGSLVDSISKQPVPFASMTVAASPTSTDYVATGLTDDKGVFKGSIKKSGTYYATFRFLGYEDKVVKFTIKSSETKKDLGKVLMVEKVDSIATVNVVAQKPLISAEAGKIKYNSEGDPDNKTATVLDMLRKIPMVTVDGEDNISINGNSSFVVYQNGKKNTMMSERPSEIFKTMPATSVKNIEIITDPGSKFDAEGAGGIINLITDHNTKTNQTSGNISVGVTNRQSQARAGLSVQLGKFSASISAMVMDGKSESSMHSNRTQDMEDFYTKELYKQLTETSQSSDGDNNMGNFSIEASYEFDSLNLVSVSASLMKFKMNSNSIQDIILSKLSDNSIINNTNMINSGDNQFTSYSVGFDYQHLFGGNANKYLTFSYNMWIDDSEMNNLSATNGLNDYFMGRKSENTTSDAEHTFQIDYTNTISKTLNVDAGAKFILRPKDSQGLTYSNVNDVLTLLDDQTVDYTYKDDIGAIYTQLGVNVSPKISLRGGLRYEYTYQDTKYKNKSDQDFSTNYDILVPSATFNYAISTGMMKSQNLSFTYNLRISRPREQQLNPYKDYSGVTTVRFGNPDLECQKFHNLSLSYGLFSMKQNLNLRLGYNYCNNGITNYTFTENNIINSTYKNATEQYTLSGNIFYSYSFGRNLRIMTNASINYSDMSNDVLDKSNSGWAGNVFANLTYTTPFKLKTSIGGMMSSKRKTIEGESDGMQMGMFSLERSFLKDKLTVSFSANLSLKDGMTMKMKSYTKGTGYEEDRLMNMEMGRYGVTVTYKFGKQIQVKKAKNGIKNDDMERSDVGGDDSGAGQSQQGGGAPMGGGMQMR